jgi:hypothetical protein
MACDRQHAEGGQAHDRPRIPQKGVAGLRIVEELVREGVEIELWDRHGG